MLLLAVLKLSLRQAREHGVRSSLEAFGTLDLSQRAASAPHLVKKLVISTLAARCCRATAC
jgi:hypothetical protein